jgi:hypothetical protein
MRKGRLCGCNVGNARGRIFLETVLKPLPDREGSDFVGKKIVLPLPPAQNFCHEIFHIPFTVPLRCGLFAVGRICHRHRAGGRCKIGKICATVGIFVVLLNTVQS